MLKELVISIRPQQWYKNLLIFVGLVFSHNLLNVDLLIITIFGFIAFCLAASGTYVINDILDKDRDRKHPKKSKRPVASGKLSIPIAATFAVVLIALSLLLSIYLNFLFFIAVISYLILNFVYSIYLKKLVIFDILTISAGFVIRAVAGCVIIGALVSPWLILCTFLLATFLALGKRRHELVLLENSAKDHREVLGLYSKEVMEHLLMAAGSMTIISYSLYTFTESLKMMLTIPVVVYGIFRYILLTHANFGNETELIFRDRGIAMSIIIWVALVIVVMYW